jgi:hypothetical protein
LASTWRILPLSDEQRAELASCTSFAELHERLSAQSDVDAAEAAQASVGTRLNLNTRRAELEEAEMLALDASGRVMLKATPPIRRTKVVPEPWRTNILVRGWRRLTGRSNPPASRRKTNACCPRLPLAHGGFDPPLHPAGADARPDHRRRLVHERHHAVPGLVLRRSLTKCCNQPCCKPPSKCCPMPCKPAS